MYINVCVFKYRGSIDVWSALDRRDLKDGEVSGVRTVTVDSE